MIPELQGRFPLRVELDSLHKDDFKRILSEPKNSLIMQYTSLLETEGVKLDITEDALDRMLDTSCDKEMEESIRSFIEEQPGVEHVDLLHTRKFGNKIYIDLEIAADRDISLIKAHEIAENVHSSVEEKYPSVKHIMIHVNPAELTQ